MNFIEAVKLAKQGKVMGYIDNGYTSADSTNYRTSLNCLINPTTNVLRDIYINDILRDDWMEVEPKIEFYSFEEAFRAFKRGFFIKRPEWPSYMETYYSDNYEELFSIQDIEAKDWIIKERD